MANTVTKKKINSRAKTQVLEELLPGYQKQATAAQWNYAAADDRNMVTLIGKVRSGVSFNEFRRIREQVDFSLDEWANYLQLSVRTLQRNEKEQKNFLPVQSERIMELTMLHNYGIDVFGDKEKFNRWLAARSVALGGIAPKELLDTNFGIQMVKDAITRIEYGVLA